MLLVLSFVFKHNFLSLVGMGTPGTTSSISQPDTARDQAEQPEVQFVSFVLDDAQKTWTQLLDQQGATTATPSWSCFATASSPAAARRRLPPARSIARKMKRCTSI